MITSDFLFYKGLENVKKRQKYTYLQKSVIHQCTFWPVVSQMLKCVGASVFYAFLFGFVLLFLLIVDAIFYKCLCAFDENIMSQTPLIISSNVGKIPLNQSRTR